MRDNYNSFDYWTQNVNEHKAIRAHIFMGELPTKKSVYIHTLMFSNRNGIENIYASFPNERALLGYLQHSFLQKVFYNWVYGNKKLIMKIPAVPVTELINEFKVKGKITSEELECMKEQYNCLNKLWGESDEEVIRGIYKFAKEFNRAWLGDDTEFLYLKVFKNPEELGEFVAETVETTDREEEFKSGIGLSVDDFRDLCTKVCTDRECSNVFRNILLNKLSETL
ncbi:MAG: hypothetical protein ACRCVJ_14025 [Clostridium sp.]|uniref:hypothetical protein n=1 Tax=Clostridium sp. TaxID=1506 RepID=UPI003F3CEAE7